MLLKLNQLATMNLVESKKYTNAEKLLLSARRVGQEALMEENFAEDAIDSELAPISVQLAYTQQLLGNTQAALEAYMDIIKKNYDDEQSLAVSINNLITLRGPKDVSDSLKKLDRVVQKGDGGHFQLALGLDIKIFGKHKESIYMNRALLLHGHRIDQAREQVNALLSTFPDSVLPVLLQAALLVRENKAVRAEEELGHAAEMYPDKANTFLLSKAQVAAAAGHLQVAADSMAKVPDIQHMPATVATIVALKEPAGDIDGADAVFDSAIEWWSNSMNEDNNKLTVIMKEAASFKLKHGREREAFQLFDKLVKSHKSVDALVGLVTTAAHVDVEKAEAYEKQLESLPGLKGIDVDALEKTSGAKHAESSSRSVTIEGDDENKNKEKTKKKRKRKPRYLKGFDPANPGPREKIRGRLM